VLIRGQIDASIGVGEGCMLGNANDCGLPGIEGTADLAAKLPSATNKARPPKLRMGCIRGGQMLDL